MRFATEFQFFFSKYVNREILFATLEMDTFKVILFLFLLISLRSIKNLDIETNFVSLFFMTKNVDVYNLKPPPPLVYKRTLLTLPFDLWPRGRVQTT